MAKQATERALDIAEARDAKIHAMYVVDTRNLGEPALSSMEVLIGEYEDHGRDVLREVVEAAQERGIEIETQCNHGDPSEQIKHAIDRLDPDLTVMGLRGETHEKRTGTVTRKMTREFENVVIER